MSTRVAKLVPWYHQAKDRCVTTVLAGHQCTNSASYEAVKNSRVRLCKVHADMADFPVKRIRERTVTF